MRTPEQFTPRELVEWLVREANTPPVSDVCVMPGRSYGECWGCPALKCERHLTPFESIAEDRAVLNRVVEGLKSNRYWIGNESGREWWASEVHISGDEEGARDTLIAAFVEHREDYLVNLAVEAVTEGQMSLDEATTAVGWRDKNESNTKSLPAFKKKVEARLSAVKEGTVPGRQKHTHQTGTETETGEGPRAYTSLRSDFGRVPTASRRIRTTDGRTKIVEGAMTWQEYENRVRAA